MPLYEYRCGCGHAFESFGNPREAPCPECGSTAQRTWTPARVKVKDGYPKWVDRLDDFQKKQVDEGQEPTLPAPSAIKEWA